MSPRASRPTPVEIDALRRFARRHAALLGELEHAALHAVPLSLPQVRVLHEIGDAAAPPAAADLGRKLAMDPGQLSRTLGALEQAGLAQRTADPRDARRWILSLSPAGREMHAALLGAVNARAAEVLAPLSPAARSQATAAMARLERVLDGDGHGEGTADHAAAAPRAPALRDPKVGELGLLVGRMAAWYHAKHGWNGEWESVALKILSAFDPAARPGRERGWVAELDGAPVGSVFLAADDAQTARLRLLWVDEQARGLGLGARLIGECVAAARAAGFARIVLWTIDVLAPARKLYAQAGFEMVEAVPGRHFGCDVVSETWALELR